MKDKILIELDADKKQQFKDKCEKIGSNMSVEIKRFIYEFLKEK